MPRLTDRQVWDLHVFNYWREQKERYYVLLADAEWEGQDVLEIKNNLIEINSRYEQAERRLSNV